MLKKFIYSVIVINTFIISFCNGFALLSHQAIIDATWKNSIRPLLIQKYPESTEDQLKDAYLYLYGGALMPDIGYSPFGSLLFTNLVHYVRSGDFVTAVIDESQNLNEYAFGLGLLCHYQADKYGHALGTNLAVPILFPKLKKEHGDTIAYEDGHSEHTRVEFGFDVIQAAKGNYDLESKEKFVGFKINEKVLERAFLKTYGLEIKQVFKSLPVAIETFRFAVKQLMPALTKNAWRARNSAILKLNPLADKKSYENKYDRKKYRENFGRPGLKSLLFTIVIGIIPKLGPAKGLKYKSPDERVDKIFENSFNEIINQYEASLKKLESGNFRIENINFDTGKKSAPGSYKLEDDTYFDLIKNHKKDDFVKADEILKKDLVIYFSNPAIIERYKGKKSKVKIINKSLALLRTS